MPPRLRDILHDLILAVSFLTRLPVMQTAYADGAVARCLRVVPLVGAAIGAAVGALYWLLARAGAPPMAAAAVAFLASAMLTGALHEDGLADVADGMGGYTRERRLEIMKDSRIGTFGGIALVLGAIIKVTSLAALPLPLAVPALAACGALARSPMAALSRWTPNARSSGLASAAGRPEWHVAVTAILLGAALSALLLPHAWLGPAWAATALGALAVRHLAMTQLGGYTGDVLGCAEQVTEMALLLLFAALAGGAMTGVAP